MTYFCQLARGLKAAVSLSLMLNAGLACADASSFDSDPPSLPEWVPPSAVFRVGPTLQSPGWPHPVSYGIDAIYAGRWGFGFSTGKVATTILPPSKIQIAHWDLRGRFHPYADENQTWRSFFVGVAVGQQTIFGKATEDLLVNVGSFALAVPTTLQFEVTTIFATPHIGWFSVWESGFTAGCEFGLQLPLHVKSKEDEGMANVTPSQAPVVRETDEYKQMAGRVAAARRRLGQSIQPYVTLLRVGWLF